MSEFRLPRLPRSVAITGPDGKPTLDFQRWWQSTVETLEEQEAAQATLLAQIQAQLVQIEAVTLANDISASWITPDEVLTATDAGSDATVTVANFTRVYDIAPAVAITGVALTGLAFATEYAVYYDDLTQADTTPTFVATTDTATARHNYVPGRHYVDTITTPADGGSGTTGGGYTPPGGGRPGGYIEP